MFRNHCNLGWNQPQSFLADLYFRVMMKPPYAAYCFTEGIFRENVLYWLKLINDSTTLPMKQTHLPRKPLQSYQKIFWVKLFYSQGHNRVDESLSSRYATEYVPKKERHNLCLLVSKYLAISVFNFKGSFSKNIWLGLHIWWFLVVLVYRSYYVASWIHITLYFVYSSKCFSIQSLQRLISSGKKWFLL